MKKFAKRNLLALLLPFSLTVWAAETELQRCRAIADDAARLTCYDALAAVPTPTPALAPANQSTAPAVETEVVATTISGAPAPVMSAEPAAAAARIQTETDFGMERKAVEQQLEQIVSRYAGTFRGWQPKSKIALENGQIWQIADGSSGAYQLESPVITIERGVFGAFYLRIEGANRAPRVKRIK